MTTARRRRVQVLVPALVAALVLAGVLVAARLAQRAPAFAEGRTSLTGSEIIAAFGPAVARQGSGRLEMSDRTTALGSTDFVVHDGGVDFVSESQGQRHMVVKRGVAVMRGSDPMPVPTLDPSSSDMGVSSIVALSSEMAKVLTFQQPPRRPQDPGLEADAVYTRTATTDDGSSVWTGSWPSPTVPGERFEARVTVDAAGLPADVDITLRRAPDDDHQKDFVTVYTYSRWAQPVNIPEPTPFGIEPRYEGGEPGPPTTAPPEPSPSG